MVMKCKNLCILNREWGIGHWALGIKKDVPNTGDTFKIHINIQFNLIRTYAKPPFFKGGWGDLNWWNTSFIVQVAAILNSIQFNSI